jgi:hypothetical protein
MQLTFLDWFVIIGYFALSLGIGLYYRKRAAQGIDEFFVSGRSAAWWLAGTSMVATTFAADTPLAVTGMVANGGIAGNWLWWNVAFSGILTVFFYARLWRRSGVLTDVEFAEIRYSGKPAAFLRGFRALYLSILINCIVMGWVNLAMVKILGLVLGAPIAAQVSRELARAPFDRSGAAAHLDDDPSFDHEVGGVLAHLRALVEHRDARRLLEPHAALLQLENQGAPIHLIGKAMAELAVHSEERRQNDSRNAILDEAGRAGALEIGNVGCRGRDRGEHRGVPFEESGTSCVPLSRITLPEHPRSNHFPARATVTATFRSP